MKKVSHRHIIAFLTWIAFLVLVFACVSWRIHTVEERTNSLAEGLASQLSEQLSSFLSISGNFETGLVGMLVDKIVTDKDLFAVKILKNDRLVYERHSGLSSEKTVQAISRVVSGEKTIGSVEVYLGIRSEFLQAAATQEMVVFACFFFFGTGCLLLYFVSLGDLPYFVAFCKEQVSRLKKKIAALRGVTNVIEPTLAAQPVRSVSIKGADENFFITGRLFRHTFLLAPDVMLRFVAEKNAEGLIHLASLFEKCAPCLGATDLQKKAIRLQEAILFSPEEVFCLEVEACIQSLENVLADLDA
ncbi:MAG: hypothetical protein IJU76_11950 [Desulfovibrionaceae bacterium]|nr:hypothetical protein [Desulfovibrionaceae bacterium]